MSVLALERLKQQLGDAVLETSSTPRGDDIALLKPESVVVACRFLKDQAELDFKLLSSITCVDRLLLPASTPRFELCYQLYSLTKNKRLRLKARLPAELPEIDTVTGVWRTANWWERMAWDLYGVRFRGHPNPKRIYMYEEFVGHPLRKDYPLKGRQPLIPERDFRDLVRGPGASPRD